MIIIIIIIIIISLLIYISISIYISVCVCYIDSIAFMNLLLYLYYENINNSLYLP